MKNKTYKIQMVIILAFLVIIILFLLNLFSANFNSIRAKKYLCEKYNVQKNELILVDSQNAHISWDEYHIFFLKPRWTDISFEFEFKGKEFFVNKIDGSFYDDYQIEDIELWCTEWFKNNVDESIIGFDIIHEDIIKFQRRCSNNTFTKSDVPDFLAISSGYRGLPQYMNVYYRNEDCDDCSTNGISNKIKLKLGYTGTVTVVASKLSDMYLYSVKSSDYSWGRNYTLESIYENTH